MEIVLIVAVIAFAGWFFFLRPKKDVVKLPEAPYKVETPAPEPQAADHDTVTGIAVPKVESAEKVEATPKKKATKPKTPKTDAAKTKPATKGAKVKRTK